MSGASPRVRRNNRNGLSRRQFIGAAAAGAVAVLGSAPAGVVSAQAPQVNGAGGGALADATLVFVNGRIHTMDARNTVARTVSIRNGRFVTVGDTAPGRVPNTRVIDLKGRTVVPGVIEGHVHIVSLANRPGYHTILENTASIREIQEALAARRKEVPQGQWITSMGGWHPNQWTEHRHPTRAELDAAVPDRPVLLYERFTGPCVTNSLGKAFFDAADAAAPVHPNIVPVKVADSGAIAAAGFAGGGPSASALFHLRRLQTFEDKKRSTLDAMAYSASLGLTAHLDEVLFPTPGPLHPSQILSNLDQYRMYDSWLALHREGKASVRLQMNFLQNQNDPALPELKERLRNQFQFFGDDMMMTGAIGEWAAPLGERRGLAGGAAPCGAGRLAQRERRPGSGRADAGGRGVRSRQQGIRHHASALDGAPRARRHTRSAHSTEGPWLRRGDGGVPLGHVDGPESRRGPQFRTIVDHGIQAGIHGDGVHIAPLNPWLHIYFATTGVNSFGDRVNGDQQITRQEALRLFTKGNSWFLRMEDKIGTIEPGKLADLAVLDRDYFSVPDAEIKKIRAVLTVVDGRIVHDSKVL